MRWLICLVLIAACGDPAPSPSDQGLPVPVGPAVACMALAAGECLPLAGEIVALLGVPPGALHRLELGPMSCQAEPCPRALAAGPSVTVIVDYADARRSEALSVRHADRPVRILSREPYGIGDQPFPPRSAPVVGPGPHPFELAHCGLHSGIDFGGTWWDPIGEVDAFASEAINAARGKITITGPTTAVFDTGGGFRVELIRRPGAKWLPGCQ